MPNTMNSLLSNHSTAAQLLLARAIPQSLGDTFAALIIVASAIAYSCANRTWNRPNPLAYKWYERPQAADSAIKSNTSKTRDIAQRLDEAVIRT